MFTADFIKAPFSYNSPLPAGHMILPLKIASKNHMLSSLDKSHPYHTNPDQYDAKAFRAMRLINVPTNLKHAYNIDQVPFAELPGKRLKMIAALTIPGFVCPTYIDADAVFTDCNRDAETGELVLSHCWNHRVDSKRVKADCPCIGMRIRQHTKEEIASRVAGPVFAQDLESKFIRAGLDRQPYRHPSAESRTDNGYSKSVGLATVDVPRKFWKEASASNDANKNEESDRVPSMTNTSRPVASLTGDENQRTRFKADRDRLEGERDRAILQRDVMARERDLALEKRDKALEERDKAKDGSVNNVNMQLAGFWEKIENRDTMIKSLKHDIENVFGPTIKRQRKRMLEMCEGMEEGGAKRKAYEAVMDLKTGPLSAEEENGYTTAMGRYLSQRRME